MLVEVTAGQKLHHHVGRAVWEAPHVHHARDVIAVDLGRGASFVHESCDHLAVGGNLGEHDFERDRLREELVLGSVDDPHAPLTKHSLDAVLAVDQRADLEDRRRRSRRHPPLTRCLGRPARAR